MHIEFRPAVASDASELTNIAFAAKRHWNYPDEWIELWADELTVEPRYIESNWVLAAIDGSRLVGWCAVVEKRGEHWLDYCWIVPEAAGKGIGRILVKRALDHAAKSQAVSLKVISDPHAEGFYHRMGFRTIGKYPSKPHERRLPILEADIEDG